VRTKLVAATVVSLGLLASACGSSSGSSSTSASAITAKTASLSSAGGMAALVKAAKAEGTLNVITLPPDGANYGQIITDFSKKYGIKINSANPNGSSANEITAVKQLKGQSRAPDVLDLGNSFALEAASSGLLAPYKVSSWAQIPASQKAANGDWFADYGGFVAIGYNSAKVKVAPTSFESGQTPVLIWWDYLEASAGVTLKGKANWKINIPTDGHYASYYDQAISATAPHPAAARLWEEYLYSTTGQNLWLGGMARPIELASMITAGTADKTELAALPAAPSSVAYPTVAQITKAEALVQQDWASMVGAG
jgi:ABC-type Fe3+ transport system substrate-binding protein